MLLNKCKYCEALFHVSPSNKDSRIFCDMECRTGYTQSHLIGQRFGRLVVVDYAESDDHSNTFWECRCDCGKLTVASMNSMKRGNTLSCGCLALELFRKRNVLPLETAALNNLMNRYRMGALKRDLEFNLTPEDMKLIIQKPCVYCGKPPDKKVVVAEGVFYYTGIDRTDNSKGYTIDNCVPCCLTCNRAKMTKTSAEFINWIQCVYTHIFSQ